MKILVLGQEGDSTNIVVNRLKREFENVDVIIEEPVEKKTFLKRRLKKLGLKKVIGQCIFMMFVEPCLRKNAESRIKEIIEQKHLDTSSTYIHEHSYKVKSVNSDECQNIIQKLKPDLVVVNGTRIVSEHTIKFVETLMINMHLGITPKYRGVHGGYWALAMNDAENCGVTIHKVDAGIDTGNIIAQQVISVNSEDNFCTYPYLQIAAGIELEIEVIKKYENNNIKFLNNNLPSYLWSHPTIYEYLKYRKKGVK